MKFSLITSTIGRTTELEQLLASLDAQTCRSFELIVVDQNSHDRLAPILAAYKGKFPIVHVRSEKGLSRGRNVGMSHARGDIFSFPDDDCWYPQDLLARVARFLDLNPEWHGLSGRQAGNARWSDAPTRLTRWNIWKRAIEWTIFLRREVADKVGSMNESLGVGAGTPWGAGEGTEYLIRALDLGYQLTYQPSFEVHHPTVNLCSEAHLQKSHKYAMGQGRVLHLCNYPAWFAAYNWMRPLAGAMLGVVRGQPERTVVGLSVVQGIITGWSSGIRPSSRTGWIGLNRRQAQVGW